MKCKLVLYFFLFSIAGYSAPVLEFVSGNFVDFGKFNANALKTAVFKIKNSGDELLKITNIRKTCGCFKVLPYSKELKAGEVGEIKIEIDPTTLSGNFSKLVFIQSNDAKSSSKILRVKGNARKLCKVSPNNGLQLINIDFEKDQEKKSYSFEISPTDSKLPVALGDPEYKEKNGVSVKLINAGKYSVSVTIDSTVKKGRFRLPIAVPIKSPKGWEPITLVLYGRIR